jgi:transcription elongation factor GreA
MMKKQFYLTKEGITELQTELDSLTSRRGEIAEAIKTAREQGDLSENAEYHAAKDDHERTEGRIAEIEGILSNAKIIKKPRSDDKVRLGCNIDLKSASGKAKHFQVVGTVEADPLQGKISDESPIGQALLGRVVGDDIEIKTNSQVVS